MVEFTPVDHDPFAAAAPAAGPRMVPVDHDPFATSDKPVEPTIGKGESLAFGASRPFAGLAQLVAHIAPQATTQAGLALTQEASPGSEPLQAEPGFDITKHIDQGITDREADFRKRGGSEGLATVGQIGATLPLAALPGGLFVQGAAAGALQPVAGGDYSTNKLKDVTADAALSMLFGGLVPPGVRIAAKGIGSTVSSTLGVLTGAGREPIRQAFKAAAAGGEQSRLFLDAMRGNVPIENVVPLARSALNKMRDARSKIYRSGMVDITGDATVLDFAPIDTALARARGVAEYNGVAVNKKAAASLKDAEDAVAEWKKGNPAKFHTVEGFDKLKQRLGEIWEDVEPHTRASTIVGDSYRAVLASIEAQAPTYAKIMKEYGDASQSIHEIERALSLKDRGSVDTALRKLQSVMRNNVQTNYGNRLAMVETLNEMAGGKISPQIAGHALNDLVPRGLSRLGLGVAPTAALMGHPLGFLGLPFESPRLVGEGANALGWLANTLGVQPGGAARQALTGSAGRVVPPIVGSLYGSPSTQGGNP